MSLVLMVTYLEVTSLNVIGKTTNMAEVCHQNSKTYRTRNARKIDF